MAEGRGGVVQEFLDHTTPSARINEASRFFLIVQPPLLLLRRGADCRNFQTAPAILDSNAGSFVPDWTAPEGDPDNNGMRQGRSHPPLRSTNTRVEREAQRRMRIFLQPFRSRPSSNTPYTGSIED